MTRRYEAQETAKSGRIRQGELSMIRNIVFDFGNVIGRYNSEELIGRFCQAQADRQAFRQAFFMIGLH